MAGRNKARVRILHNEYSIVGSTPAERLHAAAAHVDRTLQELMESTASSSPEGLAILAALNIASELMELRQRVEDLESQVLGDTRQMLELLEAPVQLRTGT